MAMLRLANAINPGARFASSWGHNGSGMRRSTSLRLLPAVVLLSAAGSIAAEAEYRLKGVLHPPAKAVVTLDGFTTTFSGSILVESNGEFEFKGLRAGTYTLILGVPNRGEIRRTVEIGPGTADSKNCVPLTLALEESLFSRGLARRQGTVSVQELAVPEKARKAYAEAQRQLARRNQKKAIECLETAVRLAPGFSGAWNNLGTMYYKSAQYEKAEESFRAALAASYCSRSTGRRMPTRSTSTPFSNDPRMRWPTRRWA